MRLMGYWGKSPGDMESDTSLVYLPLVYSPCFQEFPKHAFLHVIIRDVYLLRGFVQQLFGAVEAHGLNTCSIITYCLLLVLKLQVT